MRIVGSWWDEKTHRGKGHWCAARIATGLIVAFVSISLFTAVAKAEPITSVCAAARWSNSWNGDDSRCRIGAVGFSRLVPESPPEPSGGTTGFTAPLRREAGVQLASGIDKVLMEKVLIDLSGASAGQRHLGDPAGLFGESRDHGGGGPASPGPANRKTDSASAEGAEAPERRLPESFRWFPLAIVVLVCVGAFARSWPGRRSGLSTDRPGP